MSRFLLISQTNAVFGTVISVAGIIFLGLLGSFYNAELEQLVNGKEPIEDPTAVAKGCYVGAFLYCVIGAFCYWQVSFTGLALLL